MATKNVPAPYHIAAARRWRRSWRASTALHVALVMLLLAQALWVPWPVMPVAGHAEQVVAAHAPIVDEPIEVEMQLHDRRWIEREAEDALLATVDLNDPRWGDILTEPLRRSEGIETNSADEGASELIARELLQAIEASSRSTSEANLDQLAQLSERLAAVSSEATVDELAGTFGRLLDVKPRETKPRDDAAGTFDFSTAQPHDCRRIANDDGTFTYIAVMIDAQGRTQEVPLDAATGEQLYNTLQIVKSNPLLERVYRGTVMGILDKLLREQR
jgi:hypothetical protein